MWRRRLGFLLLVLAGAAEARAQRPTGDLGRLQGKWWSQRSAANREITTVLVFEGDKVKMTTRGPGIESSSTNRVTLDEAARPKRIDFLHDEAEGEAQVGDKKSKVKVDVGDVLGIYELGGGNLKVFFSPEKGKRPASMNAKTPGWEHIAVYHRGDPPASAAARKAMRREQAAADSTRPGEFRGATIDHVDGQHVTLVTADGARARVGAGIGEAFGLDGRKLARGDSARVLKPGNVVDVETRRSTRTGQLFLASVRLVRGELLPAGRPAAPATPAEPAVSDRPATYHKARILKVSNYQMLVEVGGQQVLLGSVTRATKAFDLKGKPIADGQAARLIWEGNVVDVVTDPPTRGAAYASLREVRLVAGKVGEQNPATGLVPTR